MIELSKEEFYEKYGNIAVKFNFYCDNCFNFSYINDDDDNNNLRICIEITGQDNIKSLEFSSDDYFTINHLQPTYAKIYDSWRLKYFYGNKNR